jgi:hypothetical protein
LALGKRIIEKKPSFGFDETEILRGVFHNKKEARAQVVAVVVVTVVVFVQKRKISRKQTSRQGKKVTHKLTIADNTITYLF